MDTQLANLLFLLLFTLQVDCRRTDRNQPIFAVPEGTKLDDQVHEEPNITVGGRFDEVEEGSQTPLNGKL